MCASRKDRCIQYKYILQCISTKKKRRICFSSRIQKAHVDWKLSTSKAAHTLPCKYYGNSFVSHALLSRRLDLYGKLADSRSSQNMHPVRCIDDPIKMAFAFIQTSLQVTQTYQVDDVLLHSFSILVIIAAAPWVVLPQHRNAGFATLLRGSKRGAFHESKVSELLPTNLRSTCGPPLSC